MDIVLAHELTDSKDEGKETERELIKQIKTGYIISEIGPGKES